MKKKSKQDITQTSRNLGERLYSHYLRWKSIYDNGCSDPFWEDGVNINLVRNHILYEKRQVEEVLGDNYIAYPNEYFYPTPDKLPNTFMAKDREISGKFLTSNKTLCYNEVVAFKLEDWRNIFNPTFEELIA